MSDLQSLGIGGILVILVLREVFAFLTKKSINGAERRLLKEELAPVVTALTDCRKEVIDTRHVLGNALAGITLGVEILVHTKRGPR